MHDRYQDAFYNLYTMERCSAVRHLGNMPIKQTDAPITSELDSYNRYSCENHELWVEEVVKRKFMGEIGKNKRWLQAPSAESKS